jgi:hypothetical protein
MNCGRNSRFIRLTWVVMWVPASKASATRFVQDRVVVKTDLGTQHHAVQSQHLWMAQHVEEERVVRCAKLAGAVALPKRKSWPTTKPSSPSSIVHRVRPTRDPSRCVRCIARGVRWIERLQASCPWRLPGVQLVWSSQTASLKIYAAPVMLPPRFRLPLHVLARRNPLPLNLRQHYPWPDHEAVAQELLSVKAGG